MRQLPSVQKQVPEHNRTGLHTRIYLLLYYSLGTHHELLLTRALSSLVLRESTGELDRKCAGVETQGTRTL